MSSPKTSEKSVYLDREEHFHKGTIGAKTVVPYFYNSETDTLSPASNATTSVNYALRLDDTSTANVTYLGKAATGTPTTEAGWQIQKIDETSGTVITWASGNDDFSNIWDNRTGYTYS